MANSRIPPNIFKQKLATIWVSLVAAEVVAVSNAVAETIPKWKNAHKVYNGIDLDKFDLQCGLAVNDYVPNLHKSENELEPGDFCRKRHRIERNSIFY